MLRQLPLRGVGAAIHLPPRGNLSTVLDWDHNAFYHRLLLANYRRAVIGYSMSVAAPGFSRRDWHDSLTTSTPSTVRRR